MKRDTFEEKGHFIFISFAGIGYATLGITSTVIVQQYFDKKRSLASGIYAMGMGLGLLISPPVTRFLIDTYSWQGSLLILAGFTFQLVVLTALFRQFDGKNFKKSSNLEKEESGIRVWLCSKTIIPFLLYLCGVLLQHLGHCCMLSYLPLKSEEVSISKIHISFILSILGIVSLCSRLFMGWLGDLKCVNRLVMNAVANLICGISLIAITKLNTFPQMAAVSVVWAISAGELIINAILLTRVHVNN